MILMLIGIAIFISFLVISNLVILLSLNNLFKKPASEKDKKKLFSIVIAVKNESHNIKNLIKSLEQLNYPEENFEVILVDDNSTDNTYNMIKSNICDKQNFKVIKADIKILPGKKGALDIGIKNAKNPFIMITDADCQPEPGWLSVFALKFDEYDLLFGIAPFKCESSLINHISCFENLRASILTFAFANVNSPYSAAARSFGFSKEAFYVMGGYNNTIETLSGDDDLLIREAVKHKLKIGTITNKNAFVFSSAKSKLNNYLTQKARHTSTSNHYLIKHKIFLAGWHSLNILCLFSPILCFFSSLCLIPFVVKFIFDITLTRIYQSKFGYRFNFPQTFCLQIFYEIFLIINYANSVFGKRITWK